MPNANNLKICCNSANASQTYLSGNSKYQILLNNNSGNCAKKTQLTCNNNVIMDNKNLQDSSIEDNNENILKIANSKNKTIDTVDSPLNNHHSQSLNHQITSIHHLEQSATNQQQFNNQLINSLTGSCSQLNQLNYNISNTNLSTNHSMSLSNLTNLSNHHSSKNQIVSNFNTVHPPCNPKQCTYCLETNNNLIKFNSFGNDVSEPVEILPHLLLGSELHASQLDMLKRIGVTALLNVSHSCPNHFEKDFTYKCIPVQDSNYADISVYFDDAIQFIGKFLFFFFIFYL